MVLTALASCALLAFSVVHGQNLRNITVDDTNSTISYSGPWDKTNTTNAYKGGYQTSNGTGATATYTFTGVGVYYFMPLFENITGGVSTILTLDSGPAQLVNLTRTGSESIRSAVRWGASDLSNGRHTLVVSPGRSARGEVAGWGAVDGFIYTTNDYGTRSFTISCDDPRITYSPRGVWTTNTTNLPSCAISKSGVRVTSTPNATFDFEFTGDTVSVNTINSPRGGKISLSVNGGSPQIYDTYASSTGCGSSRPQKVLTVKVKKRSLSYSNFLTVKNVDGETQVDGITDGQSRPNTSAAHRTIFMDGKLFAGTIFFISYLFFFGIL